MTRPLALYPLVLILVLLGISAAFGGCVLMFSPATFGIPPDWLAETPFRGFFLPGLILLLFNGVFPLLAALGLLLRPQWRWANALNIYRDRHWGWTYALFSGIIVIVWITVQITMVEYSILQPAYIAVGLLILILTLWPSVMRHFQLSEK